MGFSHVMVGVSHYGQHLFPGETMGLHFAPHHLENPLQPPVERFLLEPGQRRTLNSLIDSAEGRLLQSAGHLLKI